MAEHFLISAASILILGLFAQWVGWRVRFPAILLLLLTGIIAGPLTGLLDPDQLFGELLFPFVSVSVALILFEGGLTLTFSELGAMRSVLRNLISAGALITWIVLGAAAHFLLELPTGLAALLGAILVVSGPTVVLPLLSTVNARPRLASLLKWEGIVIDPVGATLAVLVFEVVSQDHLLASAGSTIIIGELRTLVAGGLIGLLGAVLLVVLLRNYWVPTFLQSPITLVIVVTAFTTSNILQVESGLLAVTVMGIALANQRYVPVRHILEFKENLRVLLLSTLFIVLAARINLFELQAELNLNGVFFLLAAVFIARPLSVWASSIGSDLTWQERIFLSWMAPRGIVAASVSAVFAFSLVEQGMAGASRLVPVTFLVIIATVLLYGLTAKPLARLLGVAAPEPQGVLVIGAHDWARKLAQTLQQNGITVRLVDTNQANIEEARREGLSSWQGNVLSEDFLEEMDLEGLGQMIALTSNDEVNSLAALRLAHRFDRANAYHLAGHQEVLQELRGRALFSADANYRALTDWFQSGARIQSVQLTPSYTFGHFRSQYGSKAIPLFVLENGKVNFITVESQLVPRAGQVLYALIQDRQNDPLLELERLASRRAMDE